MHEMGVVIQMIKTANSFAEENGAKAVRKLTVQIGEMSPIMPQYVEMFFGDVIPDYPLLNNCKLVIESEEPLAFCLDCGESYNPKASYDRCPRCRSKKAEMIAGKGFMIKSMEVE